MKHTILGWCKRFAENFEKSCSPSNLTSRSPSSLSYLHILVIRGQKTKGKNQIISLSVKISPPAKKTQRTSKRTLRNKRFWIVTVVMSAFVPTQQTQAGSGGSGGGGGGGGGGNRNRNRNQQKRVRRSDSGVELDAQSGGGGRGGGGNGGNRPPVQQQQQQQQVNFNVNSLKNMLGVASVAKPSGNEDEEDDDEDDGDEIDVGGLVGDPTLMSHMTGAKFGDIVGASQLTKRAIADVMKYTFMTQVQKESIPEILKGKDVFVKAKTGIVFIFSCWLSLLL